MTKTVLFVYGTLKRGESNEFRTGDQECLGPARTLPLYRLYALGWHPGLVLHRRGSPSTANCGRWTTRSPARQV